MTLTLTEQEVAVLKLIGFCEGITGSGLLGENSERMLRERVVATCNAFGFPTIAERHVFSATRPLSRNIEA